MATRRPHVKEISLGNLKKVRKLKHKLGAQLGEVPVGESASWGKCHLRDFNLRLSRHNFYSNLFLSNECNKLTLFFK